MQGPAALPRLLQLPVALVPADVQVQTPSTPGWEAQQVLAARRQLQLLLEAASATRM